MSTKGNERRRGIGLSSVTTLVEMQRGRLAFFSAPGTGSAVIIDLPARDSEGARLGMTDTAEDVAKSTVANVILVDDEPMSLSALRTLFKAERWDVSSFSHPREALDFIRSAPNFAQLLVTDWHMPQMNGGELAAQVKRIRPDLPIILCSNALVSSDHDAIDDKLAKPPKLDRLQAILKRHKLAISGKECDEIFDSGRPRTGA